MSTEIRDKMFFQLDRATFFLEAAAVAIVFSIAPQYGLNTLIGCLLGNGLASLWGYRKYKQLRKDFDLE